MTTPLRGSAVETVIEGACHIATYAAVTYEEEVHYWRGKRSHLLRDGNRCLPTVMCMVVEHCDTAGHHRYAASRHGTPHHVTTAVSEVFS